MTEITRYIFRQLIVGATVVSCALACIVWLTQSLRFLQFVVTKGLALGAWLKLTLLLMPGFLVVVIPPALFFVTLFVYNKLMIDRELVVLQAAGVSRIGLTKPAMLAAIVAALACYSLTLYIAPNSVRAFRELQWSIRNDASRILLQDGAFNQIAPGLTIYVRGRSRSGQLLGIMVHDIRDPNKRITVLAERGVMAGSGDTTGPHVLLFNGSRQELEGSGTNVSVLYFDSYTLDFGNLEPEDANRAADYRERSLFELLRLNTADGFDSHEIGRMRAEAHQRLVGPLNTFGFALVALACLLRGGFDKRGQLGRLGGAVVVLIVLEAAGLGAEDIVGRSPDAVPLMYAVGLLPMVVGLYIIAWPARLLPVWRWGAILRTAAT